MTKQRVALITGCGKANGIGAEIARRLSRMGMAVAVTDVAAFGVPNGLAGQQDETAASDGLQTLAAELAAAGTECRALIGDVSAEADAERMVSETYQAFDRIDVLVNNAGAPQGPDYSLLEDLSTEAFDHVMAVNTRGTFLMMRSVVPIMRKARWGRIVNISSTAAKTGTPKLSAYSASKAAVIALTRCTALEVGAAGITVNAVCPGPTMTSRTINSIRRQGSVDFAEGLARRIEQIPAGRYGEPGDVASAVAFLASDEAAFVTAQALTVDGGYLPV